MKVSFVANGKKLLLGVFAIGFLLFSIIPLYAAQVTLVWDKPKSDKVVGYHLYSGISGTNFKSLPVKTINSTDTTTCTLIGFDEGIEYAFAATSFDALGVESDFTPTITYIVPSSSITDVDGDGFTTDQGDTDDYDATIFPGATEVCGDGIDQDCNGRDLVCITDPETEMRVFGETPDADYVGTLQDTFININEDLNSSQTQLNTYTWPENKPANSVLIKFDLSKLPTGAQIQRATLTLYQNDAGGDV